MDLSEGIPEGDNRNPEEQGGLSEYNGENNDEGRTENRDITPNRDATPISEGVDNNNEQENGGENPPEEENGKPPGSEVGVDSSIHGESETLSVKKKPGRRGRKPRVIEKTEEDGSDDDKKEGEPEKRKYVRQAMKIKMQNVKQDYSGINMDNEKKLVISYDSGLTFNDRIIINKIKLKQEMKRIERNVINEGAKIETSMNAMPGAFVPIYMYDKFGSEFYNPNQTTDIETTTVGHFVKMNLDKEGTHIAPENYTRLGTYSTRRFQRRRRRRTNRNDDDE